MYTYVIDFVMRPQFFDKLYSIVMMINKVYFINKWTSMSLILSQDGPKK